MPWTAKDVDRHKKGLSDKQKKLWVRVANSALKRCLGKGGDQGECEGSAIRQANEVADNMKEYDMSYRGYFTSGSATVEINAIDVDGEAVPVGELVAAYQGTAGEGPDTEEQAVSEAVWTTAFVNDLPDSSFALVEPGGEKDEEGKTVPRSLRHLPYKDAGGKVDIPHLRNALSRLPQVKGVAAGLISRALKKLQAVAKKHLKTYQKEMEAVDLAVALVESFGLELDAEEMAEAEFSESASGRALALAEAQAVTGGPRAPLLMDVALIAPGWGNKKDNHYYSPEVLRRDAKVFEGVKMYATDHRPGEKNVRSEVSVVREITGFTEEGAPIAQVAVHDPDFAEATRNREKLGTLGTLECSILATGRTKKGKAPDGRKGNIVEAITSAMSVDWVTKAGAGGHAIALAENDTGGEIMSEQDRDKDKQVEETSEAQTEEVTLTENQEQAQEKEEPQKLEETEVAKLLSETNLPSASKKRLVAGEYEDESALREAILAEVEYVKALTGSGQPFAQGGGTAPGEERMSEADYDTAYADILRRHGLYVPQQEVT